MEILQARILEWVAMPSSGGSSQPRDRTQVSHIAGGFFTIWATREAPVVALVLIFSYSGHSASLSLSFPIYKMMRFRDFPGSPVVKNLPYIAGDAGSIPGQGTKILHEAVGRGQLSPHA